MTCATIWTGVATAQAPPQPATGEATFHLFLQSAPVGTEQVEVTRSEDGWTIVSTSRFGTPFDLVVRHHEVRYDSRWQPLELTIDATRGGEPMFLQTAFSGTSATSQITQGERTQRLTASVAADTVVLPNNIFGGYEALAARLSVLEAGAELRIFVGPEGEIPVRVNEILREQILTGSETIVARRHRLAFLNPSGPLDVEVWADEHQRLLRVSIPLAGVELARADIVTTARRQAVSHPGDEDVNVAAAGFNLAATITKPEGRGQESEASTAAARAAPVRWPAIVLVPGSGLQDRDETVFGIPIFGYLAGALADRGFLVARYDKRGVGRSGGRAETATLADYADDVLAMAEYLTRRKDVDPTRIALLGHSEGGWVSLQAAARERKKIAAVVLVAAPGTTGADLVLEQQQLALARLTISRTEKEERVTLQKKIHDAVTGKGPWDDIPPPFRRQADTPWFHSFLLFDPAAIMPRVRQPVLVVHGARDRQVLPHHAARLAELAKARKGSPAAEVATLDGVNHLLVKATTGEMDEYPSLVKETISPDLVEAVAAWLGKLFASAARPD